MNEFQEQLDIFNTHLSAMQKAHTRGEVTNARERLIVLSATHDVIRMFMEAPSRLIDDLIKTFRQGEYNTFMYQGSLEDMTDDMNETFAEARKSQINQLKDDQRYLKSSIKKLVRMKTDHGHDAASDFRHMRVAFESLFARFDGRVSREHAADVISTHLKNMINIAAEFRDHVCKTEKTTVIRDVINACIRIFDGTAFVMLKETYHLDMAFCGMKYAIAGDENRIPTPVCLLAAADMQMIELNE
jgi:hypothetical protein